MRTDRTYIIAEVGINHNGNLETALDLITAAAEAGCDAVKFQMRTPELSLPKEMWDVQRDTPWGEVMSYIDYRKRIELGDEEYYEILNRCGLEGIDFGASPWDVPAALRLAELDPAFVKVASASLTNVAMLQRIARMHKPVIMSTGMSTVSEVMRAYHSLTPAPQLGILACTSAYPARSEDLHLNRIHTLMNMFPEALVGYSGHEPGLWTTLCAVAMGARIVERHITLDRSMKGSDHGASVEPKGFQLLVREIRNFEQARGCGDLYVRDCEQKDLKRLRG